VFLGTSTIRYKARDHKNGKNNLYDAYSFERIVILEMAAVKHAGDHFIYRYIYPLFNAKNETEVLTRMVWISFFYTKSVILIMLIIPAPYDSLLLYLYCLTSVTTV